MKYYLSLLIILALPFSFVSAVDSRTMNGKIVVDAPRSGFTTQQTVTVKGTITDYASDRAQLTINGIPQTIFLKNGAFNFRSVVSPGNNLYEFKAGDTVKRVSFYAAVPPRDIKIVFIWDTPTFTDLWVVDPNGEKCYWSNTRTKSGGNLTYNDATYAPQIFTMSKAMHGTYSVQAQYYASHGQPVTRVHVYVVLYEGTPLEKMSHYQFTFTKEQEVYDITSFSI